MAKNPCAKMVTPEHAYEVWQTDDGRWTHFVLKKYRSEEATINDPSARYHCAVQSPLSQGKLEYGDVYAVDVKVHAHTIDNPLHLLVQTTEQVGHTHLIVQSVTDEVRTHFTVTDLTPRARKHKRYQIDLPVGCVHSILKEFSSISPIEFYDCQDGRVIVTTHAWNQLNASMK